MKIITISFLVSMLIMGGFIFIENLFKQEKAFNNYQNQVHRNYCEIAVSREASETHLKEEGCIQ